MAEPNPDDGLVPEISELYKRNPAGWQREARRRTSLEATVEKLERVESSLDGEGAINNDDAKKGNEIIQRGNNRERNEHSGKIGRGSKSVETSARKAESNETRSSAEAENVENGRNAKRSKLSSRK